MAKRPLPSPELLRQLLDYDPETGNLTWRERPIAMFNAAPNKSQRAVADTWNKRFAGKVALAQRNGEGYRGGSIAGSDARSHRIIWAMVTGAWPRMQIDHINGVRHDNRWANLREVNNRENSQNQRLRSTNTSGHNGVFWMSSANKWAAKVGFEYLGVFDTKEDAIAAQVKAAKEAGFSERHGTLVRD